MPEKVIGMMNEAYFVGRKELLTWLNTFFKFNYDRIEQVCTGAAHCQIMDCLFPGQVPLNKVNFFARFDYEFIKNYKLLQNVFNKLNISKVIDVNRLIKGKYQDNLEFLQWMKRFFDTHYDGSSYDALARRNQAIKEYDGKWTNKITSNANISILTGTPLATRTGPNSSVPILRKNNSVSVICSAAKAHTYRPVKIPASQSEETIKNTIRHISIQNTELRQEVSNLERERDFYFQKLRDIEVLCQNFESNPNPLTTSSVIVDHIKRILYATDEDFVSVEEEHQDMLDE
jgi:RP/EB family microtubule-associated protein